MPILFHLEYMKAAGLGEIFVQPLYYVNAPEYSASNIVWLACDLFSVCIQGIDNNRINYWCVSIL